MLDECFNVFMEVTELSILIYTLKAKLWTEWLIVSPV